MEPLEHNRSVSRMEKINSIINWSSVESLLLKHYIESNPELETQINERISFKKFLGLPSDQESPDHYTFSRFRNRLSKEAISQQMAFNLLRASRILKTA